MGAAQRDTFDAIFDRLKSVFRGYDDEAVTIADEPGRYYLGTHEVRAKDGYRTWLGGVEIKKNYVSAHLIPVYVYPELLNSLSPELKKRMQGKSCFNFKALDERLFKEFEGLVEEGVARFRDDGRLADQAPK